MSKLCDMGMSKRDSAMTGRSPLQDLLKTPSSQLGRILEKDRKIKELQTELELERFEKDDCHEEIKHHKQKIKKLGRKIDEKCTEISKLCNELYIIQHTTLPHSHTFIIRDVERHLRLEIKNLEDYITQLRTEEDELQSDKENIAGKLKKSEDEVKLWQQKALAVEMNYDEVTEKYEHQQHELGQLRLQYNEMSALLEEMRPTTKNNSSYLGSPLQHPNYSILEASSEDLAHAVIKVQLKDAQQKNLNLQVLLQNTVEQGNLLRA